MINGSFGVGNTTASTALVEALPALRLFDPEVVGYMLAHSLKGQAFTEPTLRHRIENDQLELAGRQWRLDHISRYTAAREWMITDADLVVDTSRLTAQDVVANIAGAINEELGVRTDG